MQIGRGGWEKAFDDDEADKVARLRTLLETGDEVWDGAAGKMVPEYVLTTSELELDALEEVLSILEGHVKHPFLPQSDLDALAKEIEQRKDPVWVEEQERRRKQRWDDQAATERRVLAEGLDALGGSGDTWKERLPQIKQWWERVKADEAKETWHGVYTANRMSARQISATGRGGTFSIVNRAERKNVAKRRDILLDRTAGGILKRTDPANFVDPKTGASKKDTEGLYDLSASLLDSRKPVIDKQLKFYKDAVLVLMPVPTERDAKIFHAISSLKDPDDNFLRAIRSTFTRIRLAQGSDMHTIYVDDTDGPDQPKKVRYGVTGRVHLTGGEVVRADDAHIAVRRTDALEHSRILGAGATQPVNEIVMVYRQHASPVFPLFAKWDASEKRFDVLDRESLEPTGDHITNKGEWVSGKS
ncbi:hypothetical protein SAMN05216553_101606 [Lentzea fradiae]|uniref:Uncharacterized protein n=1 Tax=Lentzea fradiae TaxID=200378 RepID=A0A1G7L1A6_9PSEU|nr:hypothetical protein SAMN05216553_101606 [Lentzea fradiae]